ncbi:hypothetical protein QE152_g6171 [Popillia japonica]|uniref:Uncharacterized protein n=1 Tax=Popillia japonica TaxID=7064 RepID=A0AAW1MJB8_POPJA
MKLIEIVTLLVLMMHHPLVMGFRLEGLGELTGRTEMEQGDNYNREADNNTDIIKEENNWKAKEMEEISQSERRPNLKRTDQPSTDGMLELNRYQTIPDQFYDYAKRSRSHLKDIEDEKIAKENKKFENIFVVGEDREAKFDTNKRRRSLDTDSAQDLENKSGFRDYENALSDNAFFPTETKPYSSVLADHFVNNNQNLEEKRLHNKAIVQQQPHGVNIPRGNNNFDSYEPEIPSTNQEKHISNIKEEVSKLQDLVQILRDQQYILKLLDEVNNTTQKPSVASEIKENDFDFYNLAKFTTDKIESKMNSDETRIDFNDKPLDEIEQKVDNLKRKLNELNTFVKADLLDKINKEALFIKMMNMKFEQELKNQKNDLLNTKTQIFKILKKLLTRNKEQYPEALDNNSELKNIVSELKMLEKNISTILAGRSHQFGNEELVGKTMDVNNIETSVEDPPPLQSRATFSRTTNDDIDEELDRLLNSLSGNSTPKKLSKRKKMTKLLKELNASENGESFETLLDEVNTNESLDSNEEVLETILRIFKILSKGTKSQKKEKRIVNNFRKLMKNQDSNGETQDLIQLLRETFSKPKTKSIDNDENLIANLKELTEEIDKLRQKDDTPEDGNFEESKSFEELLQKLVSNSEKVPVTTSKPKSTKTQITDLIKKISTKTKKDKVDKTDKLDDSLTGTYKCEKIPNYPEQYAHINNLYSSIPHQSITYGYPEPNFHQLYNPNMPYYPQYESNPNSYKLFQSDRNEYMPPPNYYHMFPDSSQNSYDYDAGYAPKYSPNTPKNNEYLPKDKIEDLTEQIGILKNVITNLNRPEYIQRDEDQKTLENLNYQIDDLKDIVYNLASPQNYNNANYQMSKYIDSGNDQNNMASVQSNTEKQISSKDFSHSDHIPIMTSEYINDDSKYQPQNSLFERTANNKPNPIAINKNTLPKMNQVQLTNFLQHSPLTKLALTNYDLDKSNVKNITAIKGVNSRRRRSTNEINSETLSEVLVRILKDGLEDDSESTEGAEIEDLGTIMKTKAQKYLRRVLRELYPLENMVVQKTQAKNVQRN